MPKLIVTSRYLKSGSGKRKQLYHYVKYIATREGSVPIPNANETAPATKNQQELISSLLNDFPDSKELFEYEDYQKNPTVKNGSALISEILDRNMDRLTSRENYVGYLANRPGAVKFGSHGLFSQSDEPINLEKVAKEIANHGGNIWTHVVSLRRDNAQAMGYDNLNAWRELVKQRRIRSARKTCAGMPPFTIRKRIPMCILLCTPQTSVKDFLLIMVLKKSAVVLQTTFMRTNFTIFMHSRPICVIR